MLARGDASRGDMVPEGDLDPDAATDSLDTVDARLPQKPRNPPVLGFSDASLTCSSSFLSTTRQPVGTSSPITSFLALMVASQADEPFDEAKCERGLFRVKGACLVSFKAADISFRV